MKERKVVPPSWGYATNGGGCTSHYTGNSKQMKIAGSTPGVQEEAVAPPMPGLSGRIVRVMFGHRSSRRAMRG